MQMEWLKAFALLKETMNFSDAAEEMYISQSSFSKYIKALENSLGTTLIDRSHRRLTFTAQGEAVYPHVRRLLADYDQMLRRLAAFQAGERRRVRISVAAGTNASIYIRRILDFFAQRPDLELVMSEYGMSTAIKALSAGELDLAIGYMEERKPEEGQEALFERVSLRREELVYVGNRDFFQERLSEADRLMTERAREYKKEVPEESEKEEVTLRAVMEDRLIVHQNMYREVVRTLESCGVSVPGLHPIVTTTSNDVLKAYLQGGSARALLTLPALRTLDPEEELSWRAVAEHPALSLELVSGRQEKTPEQRELIRRLREPR